MANFSSSFFLFLFSVPVILTPRDTSFNDYGLSTPLDSKGKGKPQFILFDSPLLDRSKYFGTEATAIQQEGREIVKQLLENLDTVTFFSHSNFSKSLLKIAKHYLVMNANNNLKDKIAIDAQWYQSFNSDTLLCSKIIQYLTAYEQDESGIETAFKYHLNSLKDDSNKAIYTSEQVNKLAEALVQCKRVMLNGSTEDSVFKEIAKASDFQWLKDYSSSAEYGLPPITTGGPGDKSFLAYYNIFLKASDNVHRLIRTQAIHSSIFCWLLGKYKEWDLDHSKAAKEMFLIGVEGQGAQRVKAGNLQVRFENLEIIENTTIDPELAKQVGGDANYLEFAKIAKDNIFKALVPSRVVTIKSLRERATNIFKKLNQIASGKAGQILEENDKFNQIFIKYYRTILIFEKQEPTIEDFAQKLTEEADKDQEVKKFGFDMKDFINKVIEKAKAEQESDTSRNKVRKAFVSAYAQQSENRFAKEYLDNIATIKNEEFIAQNLYELSSIEKASQNDTAGTIYTVTDDLIPDKNNITQETKDKRNKKRQQQAKATLEATISIEATKKVPKLKAFEKIDPGTKGTITDGQGNKVGTVSINGDYTITLQQTNPSNADLIKEGKIEFETGTESEPTTFKLIELDMPEIADFASKSDEKQEIEKIAELAKDHYEKLSESKDKILKKYRDEENAEFNRSLRALHLCEYIQAAPKGTTQIGREDLGSILGLMVDVVEHLGEINNSKILDGVLTEDPELLKLLKKINVSLYYPVENSDELSKPSQHQVELAKKLHDIKTYLQEVAEIKNLFEMLKDTDLTIVIINTTLEEYKKYSEGVSAEDIVFNANWPASFPPPSIVYLTAQSNANPESLTKTAETIKDLINSPTTAKNVQVPIFVTSQNIDHSKIPLPLISKTNLKLPNLVTETQILTYNDNSSLNVAVDWQDSQNLYLLLSAALMLPDSSSAFGSVKKVSMGTNKQMNEEYGFTLTNYQSVVDLLRQLWLCSNGKVRLIDNLIFTKWLNLLVLAKREKNIDIEKSFGELVEKEMKENAEKISQSAFSVIANNTFPVKIKDNKDRLVVPTSLESEINKTYGTELNSKAYCFELPWKNLLFT